MTCEPEARKRNCGDSDLVACECVPAGLLEHLLSRVMPSGAIRVFPAGLLPCLPAPAIDAGFVYDSANVNPTEATPPAGGDK